MCAECHRSENGLEHHHVPVTPKYAYQFGRDGLDTMLINLKRAGVTRLNILKNPINASKLGTINRLVQIDLTRALEKVHGLRPFDLGEFRDPDDPSKKMLNSKKLTELLTENVHPKLFPKWIVMSPNATLLAYTGPSNIKELRDQAALISILWREAEHDNKKQNPKSQNVDLTSSAVLQPGSLETLTIESEKSNIIVRAIQPRLLLILVGGRPPNREENFFKITAEALGDARYPPADYTPSPPPESASSSSSAATETVHEGSSKEQSEAPRPARTLTRGPLDADLRLGLLHIQRKKVDAATEHMRADFKSKGFLMPHDLSIP